MARSTRSPYYCASGPFTCNGEKQFVEVVDHCQTIRRCQKSSKKLIEETVYPITSSGCAIEEIAASGSGSWLVTQRNSGQGEWGYDVFRSSPLARVAGIAEEPGYMLDLPKFSEDESFLLGAAGQGFLGSWWSKTGDPEEPAHGGAVSMGFLFLHRFPTHKVTRHELRVVLPKGWLPKDPWDGWYGPREISVTGKKIRLVPSWGIPVEIALPLPKIIVLPTPHPSGKGIMSPSSSVGVSDSPTPAKPRRGSGRSSGGRRGRG